MADLFRGSQAAKTLNLERRFGLRKSSIASELADMYKTSDAFIAGPILNSIESGRKM
jgi:hypothetical protein